MTPEELAAFMARHDLTQQQLAEMVFADQSTVSRWLMPKTDPRHRNINALAVWVLKTPVARNLRLKKVKKRK